MSDLSVLAAAREAPTQIALVEGDVELSFADLAERVRQRMRDLSGVMAHPLRSESLVTLLTDDTPETIELILALLELGQPFLPLHPRLTSQERDALSMNLPVRAALCATPHGVQVDLREPRPDALATELLRSAPQVAALATSGTTGAARIALLGRDAMVSSARASAKHLGWRADDRWLLSLPVAHIGGLSVVTRCLMARRPIVLLSRRARESSMARLVSAIRDGRPTLLSLVPTQLSGLLELGDEFALPGCVRVILVGGAATSKRLLEECADRAWPVLTSYGMTEACSQVATQQLGTVNRGELGAGIPLDGVEVELRGGVIHVRGPTLMTGYIGVGGEPCDPKVGFRTRDLGRFDAEGRLHILGRVDDSIITGGENVAAAEVEAVLETCDGVLEACVFGRPDAHWGEIVAAVLRVRELSEAPEVIRKAQARCDRALATFKRPRLYLCAREFVYGPTGKLDRRATAKLLEAASRSVPHEG